VGTPTPPGSGEFVSASVGIDNITALPEPAVVTGLFAGAALLAAARGRRRH